MRREVSRSARSRQALVLTFKGHSRTEVVNHSARNMGARADSTHIAARPIAPLIPVGRPPQGLLQDPLIVGIIIRKVVVAGLKVNDPSWSVVFCPGDNAVAERFVSGEEWMNVFRHIKQIICFVVDIEILDPVCYGIRRVYDMNPEVYGVLIGGTWLWDSINHCLFEVIMSSNDLRVFGPCLV